MNESHYAFSLFFANECPHALLCPQQRLIRSTIQLNSSHV